MKMKGLAVAVLAAISLAACSGESAEKESAPTASTEKKVTDIKEMVNDFSLRNLKAESASITSNELTVKESDGSEQVYDLPEDEFFVSIAPYENETHP